MGAGIGWGEFLVVLVIALLVLGPDKLPAAGRALGKALRSVRRYIRDAARELDDTERLDELREDMAGLQKDLRAMGESVEKSITEDADDAGRALKAAQRDIETALEDRAEEHMKEET